MPPPSPEDQVQFLFKVQRLLSEGSFVSTYKFALLLALADLAVERGDDSTEELWLDTLDLAEKFVDLYWRQVLPWMPPDGGAGGRLHQNTGNEAAILRRLASAHGRSQGHLSRLRANKREWDALLREVGRTIAVMPLWKLQTVGGRKLDFLYPNVGRGHRLRLRGDAIFCFRRFRGLIGDMAEGAWVRFVRRLPRNRALLGDAQDLQEFLFGADRTALAKVRALLRDHDDNRCFYCGGRIRAEAAVDHFIPWARYRLDLGHNYVLADTRCNGDKRERLAAVDHLARWHARNIEGSWSGVLAENAIPGNPDLTRRIAAWAYGQADKDGSTVWSRGPDGMVALDSRWRAVLAQPGAAAT
jgi:hypothetical protein